MRQVFRFSSVARTVSICTVTIRISFHRLLSRHVDLLTHMRSKSSYSRIDLSEVEGNRLKKKNRLIYDLGFTFRRIYHKVLNSTASIYLHILRRSITDHNLGSIFQHATLSKMQECIGTNYSCVPIYLLMRYSNMV